MPLIAAGLFLSAIVIFLILEGRRRRTGFYRYVYFARRTVWLAAIFGFPCLALSLWLSIHYPAWLAFINYASLAVLGITLFLGRTETYYKTMVASHRFYKSRSWACHVINFFQGGIEAIAIACTSTIVLLSPIAWVSQIPRKAVGVTFLMSLVFYSVAGLLFWLSNRRLYREAMDRLRKERPEWLEAGASSAGGSGGPVDRDGA
jgi:Zn-dependent protease with chaperone function